jgi:hypothetical protein
MRHQQRLAVLLVVAVLVIVGSRVSRWRHPAEQINPTGEAAARRHLGHTTAQPGALRATGIPSLFEAGLGAAPTHRAAPGNVFERLTAKDDQVLRVPKDRIDAYLNLNRTNAGSLLAAWQAGGGREYLEQAAAQFPGDPIVQMNVIAMDVFPEQRRVWLDRFKQSAADNPLANYLSAREYFDTGQPDLALKDLADARMKTAYSDYTPERLQDSEEIQMLSGRTATEAKAIAGSGLLLPHLKSLRELGGQLRALEEELVTRGDTAGAEAAALAGWGVTEHLTTGAGAHFVVDQLVGLRLQEQLLAPLPASTTPAFLQKTAQEQLADVRIQKGALESMSPMFDHMLARGDEPEITAFFDRMRLYGEQTALEWLQARSAGP